MQLVPRKSNIMPPPIFMKIDFKYKWFVMRDFDSMLMLFLDNMSSLIGILGVMAFAIPPLMVPFGSTDHEAHKTAMTAIVWTRACPGIAWALAFGNLWYGWMAAKLATFENRQDVTALPYGINTPAGFITCWNVMLPIGTALLAANPSMGADDFAIKTWQIACACNFVGGLFEIAGSVYDVRPHFAKAALYAPVAAVGFVWLALVPLTEVAKEPIIGLAPLALAFTAFFAEAGKGVYPKLSGGGALLIALAGMFFKWVHAGKYTGDNAFMAKQVNDAWDNYSGKNMFSKAFPLGHWEGVDGFIAVVFPVAVASFVETMELVETAGAAGDVYNLREAMIVDGLGTCVGAFWGSPIPTTVYIGHKRHKIIGARSGFSIGNALIYFIILNAGVFPVIFQILDAVSIGIILLIVGLMVCQQAMEEAAPRHYPAFFIGIMMLICDWATLNANSTHVGMHNLGAGSGILAAIILPQILCDLTDNRYERAAFFCLVAIFFSVIGLMHGMNPVDVHGKVTGAGFPWNNVYGEGGIMKVKGQLTISIADSKPGITGKETFPWGEKVSALCTAPPEFRVNQMMADGFPAAGMNEGWRFAVGYATVFGICIIHAIMQRCGCMPPPVMDNGVNLHQSAHVLGTAKITEADSMTEAEKLAKMKKAVVSSESSSEA